jgi:membrane protease YdiL (CAAX protease family)
VRTSLADTYLACASLFAVAAANPVVRREGVTIARFCALLVALGIVDWLVIDVVSGVGDGLVKLGCAIGALLYGTAVLQLSAPELGLARADVRRGFGVGGFAALVILLVIVVLVAVPSSRGHFTTSRVTTDSASAHWLEPLVIIPFGTVVFEELLFRGVLLGAAMRLWRTPVAVAVTSVAFGLWHLPDTINTTSGSASHVFWAVVGTIAVTIAGGVLFAWLRLRSKSLVASVLAHVATNSGAYVAALVAIKLSG